MQAAQAQLDVAANNIANAQTPEFRRQRVAQSAQPGGGVTTAIAQDPQPGPALEADIVSQLQAKNQFIANLAVFKTAHSMAGSLLDTTA